MSGYPVIRTDPNGQIWLRWNKQFETISVARDDYKLFEGRTVIIGVTPDGIGGLRPGPHWTQHILHTAAETSQTVIDGDLN